MPPIPSLAHDTVYIGDEFHIVKNLDEMLNLVERYMGQEAADLLAYYIEEERGNVK